MFDANETDFAPIALDAEETALAHGDRCGCRHCNPDDHRDMDLELSAGRRDF